MKHSLKTAILALTLLLGTMYSPRSQATIIFSDVSEGDLSEMTFSGGLLCLILLPICLLDEETNAPSVSSESLLEQGYSPREVTTIMTEQGKMSELLLQQQARLVVTETDSRESIRRDILSVMPTASDTYINFVLETKGL